MQHARGFIVGIANGWLWSPGRQSTPNSKLGKLFICKKNILSAYYIRVAKWLVTRLQSNAIGTNFAGYMFTEQSYWHKLRGLLFKLKANLLVQMAWAFVQTYAPASFSALPWAFTGCVLIVWLQVTQWGWGILPFHGKPKPKSQPPASPSPGSPT